MQLIADTTGVASGRPGRARRRTSSPNPYDGIITAEGRIGLEHSKTPHYTYCKTIFEKQTGIKIPLPNVVVKLPNGQQNDIYGNAEDACSYVTMFQDIADARRQEPEQHELDATRSNNFGPVEGHEHRLRVTARRQVRRRRHLRPRRVRPEHPAQRRLAATSPRPRTSAAAERRRSRNASQRRYALLRWIARSSVPRYDATTSGSLRTSCGRALGDHRARLHAVDAVADRQDHREVVLDDDERRVELLLHALDQRAERLGLALRDAGGRLVEADARGARPRAPTRARRCAACRSTARR